MLEIEIIKVYKQQKCVNGDPSQDRLIAFCLLPSITNNLEADDTRLSITKLVALISFLPSYLILSTYLMPQRAYRTGLSFVLAVGTIYLLVYQCCSINQPA
jgi:hypothetical protein